MAGEKGRPWRKKERRIGKTGGGERNIKRPNGCERRQEFIKSLKDEKKRTVWWCAEGRRCRAGWTSGDVRTSGMEEFGLWGLGG